MTQALAGPAQLERAFPVTRFSLRTWIKALRVYPVNQERAGIPAVSGITSRARSPDRRGRHLRLFPSLFNLWTSSVYLTYDMLDHAADRLHHRKRHRPFAPGTSLGQGRCTVAAIKEDGEAPVSEIAGSA